MNSNESKSSYIILIIVAIVAVFAMISLMQPREPSSNLERAASEISEGFEDAGRELDPNRTPGEKLGDAVEDLGENIQESSN